MGGPASANEPTVRVVTEVQPEAAKAIDGSLAQRLIALELSDVDVPAPRDVDPDARSLYFRVLATSPASLVVELWELGVPHGSRTVSGVGSSRLRARRVALAAAELARQLRQRRLIEAQHAARQATTPRVQDTPKRGIPLRARFGLDVGAVGAAVGPNHFWLAGPGLAGLLRFESGPRVGLGVRFLAGSVNDVAESPALRWLELSLSPSYTVQVGSSLGLDFGFTAAAAAVHLGSAQGVDGRPSEYDTWSGRATAHVRIEPRLGSWTWLSIGPDVGVVLRRIPLQPEIGSPVRLGGLWLGLGASVALDPSAP